MSEAPSRRRRWAMTDAQIAQALNAQGLHSSKGQPFNLSRIKWIRHRYGVPATRLQRPGEITVKQLADELGVSIYFVHYWIKQGAINARQIDGRGSLWITLTEQRRRTLHDRVRNSGHLKGRHCEAPWRATYVVAGDGSPEFTITKPFCLDPTPMLGWLTGLLFSLVPARFESAFPLEESVRRLRAATTQSLFGNLTHQVARGTVGASKVSLQRSVPFVRNSFKPFFIGRFEASSRVTLVGCFTMHPFAKVFMCFWLGFCLLWTALAAVFALFRAPDAWYFPLFGLAMFFAGLALIAVSKWFARNDVRWLSSVIATALDSSREV